jgi:hypothetical protein
MATGLLIVCVGKATKIVDRYALKPFEEGYSCGHWNNIPVLYLTSNLP